MERPKVELGRINTLNKEMWKIRKKDTYPGGRLGCTFYFYIALFLFLASQIKNELSMVLFLIVLLLIWLRLESRERRKTKSGRISKEFKEVSENWAGKLGMEYKTYPEGSSGRGGKDKITRHDSFAGKYKGYEARVEDYSRWEETSDEYSIYSTQICRTAVTLTHNLQAPPLVIHYHPGLFSKGLEYRYFWTEEDRPRLSQDHQYFWIEDKPRLKRFKLEPSFDKVFKVKGERDNQEFVLKIVNPAMREYLLAKWPTGANSLEVRGRSLVLVYTDGFLYKSSVPYFLDFLIGVAQRLQK